MLDETSEHLNDNFGRLFDEMLKERTDRLSAEPEDTEALVEAVTLYHMVIEGMLALTGQHFIMDYNERAGHAAGLRRGLPERRPRRAPPRRLRLGLPAREGAARTSATSGRSSARWRRSLPVADGVLTPPWAPEDDEDFELFGYSLAETRAVRRHLPDAAAEGHRPRLGAGREARSPGGGSGDGASAAGGGRSGLAAGSADGGRSQPASVRSRRAGRCRRR